MDDEEEQEPEQEQEDERKRQQRVQNQQRQAKARAFYTELVQRIPGFMPAWARELALPRRTDMGVVHDVAMDELEEFMWSVWVERRTCLRIVNDVMFLFSAGPSSASAVKQDSESNVFRFNVCASAFDKDVLTGIAESAFWTVHGPEAGASGERESYTLTNFRYDALAPHQTIALTAMRAFYANCFRYATLTDEYADFFLQSVRAKLSERAQAQAQALAQPDETTESRAVAAALLAKLT